VLRDKEIIVRHVVEIFGGLPGVRTGKIVEAVAICRTCGKTGRGKTRMTAKKAIKHIEKTEE
jgi:hypothetical protein